MLTCPKVIGSSRNRKVYAALSPVAVSMRIEPTGAERILWHELRAKKLGVKFRRQHIIDKFIVDFYCVELGLVIEVDGGVHEIKQSADLEREQILKTLGCMIIRFANKTVETELPDVIDQIQEIIRNLSQ